MADAPFLHIRSPDAGHPPRVVQLDRPSLRIGHGPRCDLALPDPSLAEVHCILRRRGEDWTVQPIGPSGRLSLDGRPVETTLRLPPGATLRLGRYALRLVDPNPAARFGTYPTPPPVAPETDNPTDAPPLEPSPLAGTIRRPLPPGPAPRPAPAPAAPASPWQARQPERHDLSRRDERLREWTARFESVGRDLQARAAIRPATRPAPQPAPAPTPIVTPSPKPVRPEPATPPAPPAPPAERIRLALPAPAAPPLVTPALWPEPETETETEAAPPVVLPWPVRLDATPLVAQPEVEPEPESVPEPTVTIALDVLEGEQAPIVVDVAPAPAPDAVAAEPVAPIVATPEVEPPTPTPTLVESDFELESATWRELTAAIEAPPEPPTVVPPLPVEPTPIEPVADPEEVSQPVEPTELATVATAPEAAFPSPLAGVSEWPSARVILEQYRRDRPATADPAARPAPARPSRPLPQPSPEYAPAQWRVPGRVVVGMAAGVAALVGTGMLALSLSWASDDRLAGAVADTLVRPGALPRRFAVPEESPAPSWWRSTADHLYLHALARAVSDGGDPARAAEARTLLDAARSAAPLHRQVRLAMAAGDAPAVGLSRDPVALRQAGKRLLREGKVDAALGVYREAIAMVDRVDLASSPVPPFDETTDVRRFLLPGEAVLAPILNDLAAAEIPAASRGRLYDALPRRAIVGLALFRFHRARGETAEADRAAELAMAAEPPGRPAARALHHAAQAELLALRGRPQEAVARYNEAIAAIPAGLVKRTWALNLGELEARLGHEDALRSAWALARGDDPGDAVNRRLVEARRRRGQLEPPALLVMPRPAGAGPDAGVKRAGFGGDARPDGPPPPADRRRRDVK